MNQPLTQDQMLALLKQMQDDNAALKAKLAEANKPRSLSLKVSEKGGVSLYGMGRFPVTLYKSQWQRLLAHTKQIESFLADNNHLLAEKE